MAIDEIIFDPVHQSDDPPLSAIEFTAQGDKGAYEVRFATAAGTELGEWQALAIDATRKAKGRFSITNCPGPGVQLLWVKPRYRSPEEPLVAQAIRIRCPE